MNKSQTIQLIDNVSLTAQSADIFKLVEKVNELYNSIDELEIVKHQALQLWGRLNTGTPESIMLDQIVEMLDTIIKKHK